MVQWFDLRKEGRLLLKYCNINNNSLVHRIVNKFRNSIEVYFIFLEVAFSVFIADGGSRSTIPKNILSRRLLQTNQFQRLLQIRVDRSSETLLPKLSPLTHMRTKRPSTPQISSYPKKQTPVILVMTAETNYELSGLHKVDELHPRQHPKTSKDYRSYGMFNTQSARDWYK